MGVRILTDDKQAALYCSTSEIAFGPIFHGTDDGMYSAEERAAAFLRWLPGDARRFSESELLKAFSEWQAQEQAQYSREANECS